MDELVIYKKGDNIMSCGFKLKTEGLQHIRAMNNPELETILQNYQAPIGMYVHNKPCKYNSINYVDSDKDLYDNLLSLHSKIIEPKPKKQTRRRRGSNKKNTRKAKK